MNLDASTAQATTMDSVMRQRKSVRAFRADAVPRELVEEILAIAGTAPSNSNTQPWRVHVLAGSAKHSLSDVLIKAHELGSTPPLAHFPDPLPDDCAPHQDDFGRRYYAALGIERGDAPARLRQTGRNFSFFDAPVGLIFTIAESLKPHSWLDYGLFLQGVMLGATARGLATCPQVSFARYSSLICKTLDLPAGQMVVCGMSMGYPDEAAAVNHLDMPRLRVGQFSSFAGF